MPPNGKAMAWASSSSRHSRRREPFVWESIRPPRCWPCEHSPLRLIVGEAPDLSVEGILDVARRVEAYGRVVGRAHHLTVVIQAGGHKRLGPPVVPCADGFVLLSVPGRETHMACSSSRHYTGILQYTACLSDEA